MSTEIAPGALPVGVGMQAQPLVVHVDSPREDAMADSVSVCSASSGTVIYSPADGEEMDATDGGEFQLVLGKRRRRESKGSQPIGDSNTQAWDPERIQSGRIDDGVRHPVRRAPPSPPPFSSPTFPPRIDPTCTRRNLNDAAPHAFLPTHEAATPDGALAAGSPVEPRRRKGELQEAPAVVSPKAEVGGEKPPGRISCLCIGELLQMRMQCARDKKRKQAGK
ncbi:hypothetical protein HPB48_010182 [Haemaphysalis longicornis]|uniref:Uncharacterized protein n=1 Tax=Haemaphysalis longicornis TaxID=44386 RepID=A0A9J6FX96_HAELO|nr:hypothetical protein HPB48_010182 [Haemaphysalis longicornis]